MGGGWRQWVDWRLAAMGGQRLAMMTGDGILSSRKRKEETYLVLIY